MQWWHWVGILSCLPVCWLVFMAVKYSNPYKLIMVFGKKGSGKTTFLAWTAQKYLRKGWTVYSSVSIPGTYLIRSEDVGYVQFPDRSVILMDEVGMIYDNRNYKNFKEQVRDYFKLQRHYRHRVFLFSQTFDIDLKLRNLCDSMYMMINYFNVFSVAKQIKRSLIVVAPSADSESRIADALVISPFFTWPFGGRHYLYIPHWVGLFDSYEAPRLGDRDYELIDYPRNMPPDLMYRLGMLSRGSYLRTRFFTLVMSTIYSIRARRYMVEDSLNG